MNKTKTNPFIQTVKMMQAIRTASAEGTRQFNAQDCAVAYNQLYGGNRSWQSFSALLDKLVNKHDMVHRIYTYGFDNTGRRCYEYDI